MSSKSCIFWVKSSKSGNNSIALDLNKETIHNFLSVWAKTNKSTFEIGPRFKSNGCFSFLMRPQSGSSHFYDGYIYIYKCIRQNKTKTHTQRRNINRDWIIDKKIMPVRCNWKCSKTSQVINSMQTQARAQRAYRRTIFQKTPKAKSSKTNERAKPATYNRCKRLPISFVFIYFSLDLKSKNRVLPYDISKWRK